MGIWEEGRDYKAVAASQTKAALGPGSKITDGDVLNHLIIIPTTTSPGSVTVFDGSSDTGTVVFVGGASSLQNLSPIWISFNMRAKNAAGSTNGPRWLVSTGTNVAVIAVGTFH